MTTVTYNHCDPPKKQTPLPIKQRDLPWEELSIRNCIEKRISIPTAGREQVVLSLCTDSSHLTKFFAANWLADTSSVKPSATITALRGSATLYGLAQELDESRWFCPKTSQVWMFGNEFYGNIKITVRGLCSEVAPPEQMFLHGCSLAIDGRGVVLSGASGAGILCNEIIDYVKDNQLPSKVIPISSGDPDTIAVMLYGPIWVDTKSLLEKGSAMTRHKIPDKKGKTRKQYRVYHVRDEEIVDAMKILRQTGISAEASGASGFAILPRLRKIDPNFHPQKHSVLVINTGNGLLNFS